MIGCQGQQPAANPDASIAQAPAAKEQQPRTAPIEARPNSLTPGVTKQDLDRIEAALKIKLPAEYRQFMPARSQELASYTYPLRGQTERWLDSKFFCLDADRLISENLSQREPDWAAAEAFPGWWKEYVLFGTNGGGDYYALRLDGTPGVWFLACDAATIKLYAKSLEDYVAKSLEDFPKELAEYQRLEKLWQQKVRGEIDEAEFEKKWQEILDET